MAVNPIMLGGGGRFVQIWMVACAGHGSLVKLGEALDVG